MSTKKKLKEKRYGLKDLEKRLGPLSVGKVLRSWRISEELGLKEFGKQIGLTTGNLSDIEHGRTGVSPKMAAKIAKALGMPPALLVRLAIEEGLRAAGLRYRVELQPAV